MPERSLQVIDGIVIDDPEAEDCAKEGTVPATVRSAAAEAAKKSFVMVSPPWTAPVAQHAPGERLITLIVPVKIRRHEIGDRCCECPLNRPVPRASGLPSCLSVGHHACCARRPIA